MTAKLRTKKAVKTRKPTGKAVSTAKKLGVKIPAIKEKQTRVEILQNLSDRTGLKRVDVEAVFTELAKLVTSHLKKRGSGEIMIPKLGLKIRRVKRKATKKRKMVSPLTGSEVVIPAKPARDDVKLVALKALKEAVEA